MSCTSGPRKALRIFLTGRTPLVIFLPIVLDGVIWINYTGFKEFGSSDPFHPGALIQDVSTMHGIGHFSPSPYQFSSLSQRQMKFSLREEGGPIEQANLFSKDYTRVPLHFSPWSNYSTNIPPGNKRKRAGKTWKSLMDEVCASGPWLWRMWQQGRPSFSALESSRRPTLVLLMDHPSPRL